MAIIRENNGSFGDDFSGTSGTITGAIGFTPTVGRKLLLSISHFSQATITRLTQPGVVWSRLAEDSEPSVSGLGTKGEIWHGDVVGPTPTATVTMAVSSDSSGDSAAVAVHEVSGLKSVWPFEGSSALADLVSPMDTESAGLNIFNDAYLFGAACGSSSDVASIPAAPGNGLTGPVEDVIGTNGNINTAHRCTTAEKIVSVRGDARTSWAYAGFVRWAALVGSWSGDTAPAQDINLVQQKDGSGAGVASLQLVMNSAPAALNTMILAVATGSPGTVIGVSQTNVIWVLDKTEVNASNVSADIWRSDTIGATPGSTVTITLSGAADIVASVQEYSGILKASSVATPIDQVAGAQGGSDPVRSGQTAVLTTKNAMVFASLAHSNAAADHQNSFGYLRVHQTLGGAVVGASFMANQVFEAFQYESQSEGGVSGNWAGAIVAYKSENIQTPPGMPLNVYSAESNQGGTISIVSSGTTPVDSGAVAGGNFVDGHRHLLLACARGSSSGRMGWRLNVTGVAYDESKHLPFSGTSPRNEMWGTNRLLTLSSTDDVKLESIWHGGNAGLARQTNLVIIDLDSGNFFKGRDWEHDENSTLISEMDSVFANNVGSTLRFQSDGVSAYLVIGHAMLSASTLTSITAEMAMQLWDDTNSAELGKAGWQRWLNNDGRNIAMNCMAVITPPAGTQDLSIRCVGGTVTPPDGWDHQDSSITVLRLNQLVSSGYDQNLSLGQVSPGDIMPSGVQSVDPQAAFVYQPDVLGQMVTMAFSQADNSADDDEGLASQARFKNLNISNRTVWDTADTTLGNIVGSSETNNGSGAGGSVVTRIPTWGVSHRSGVIPSPATVSWHNGGLTGNASVVDRISIVSFGLQTVPAPPQTPAPAPVTPPQVQQVLVEKPPGTHEAEALDKQLEQFKP